MDTSRRWEQAMIALIVLLIVVGVHIGLEGWAQ